MPESTPWWKRVAWWLVRRGQPAQGAAMWATALLVATTGHWWVMAVWLYTAVAADFDRGWNRPIERPVTEGMVRLHLPGKPPVDVPPTRELLEELVRVIDIVEGDDA